MEINLAQQEGILESKVLAAADIPEMKHRIQQRFKALREAEDKCVVMQSQMDGIQDQAEEMLEGKCRPNVRRCSRRRSARLITTRPK
jgi:hypothetical protein